MHVVIIFAIIAAIGIFIYMMFIEQFRIRVREIELEFPNLPESFDGCTILHLADLHISKLGLLEKKTMDIIGRREVDLCFVTGDITAEPRASDIFRRICSVIRHRNPIFTVLGNSEHKPWIDADMLAEALLFDGEEMLINSASSVRRENEHISIVGVDDPYSGFADLEKAFHGIDPNDFIIFLTHCPSAASAGLDRGADLILSGHTHGGQVRIPGIKFFWTHIRGKKSINDGLYAAKDLSRILHKDVQSGVVFVHRGVGTSKLHIRLFCLPEIVYITLRRSA